MTTDQTQVVCHPVPKRLLDASKNPVPYVDSMDKYKAMWTESVDKPDQFFGNVSSSKCMQKMDMMILTCRYV